MNHFMPPKFTSIAELFLAIIALKNQVINLFHTDIFHDDKINKICAARFRIYSTSEQYL